MAQADDLSAVPIPVLLLTAQAYGNRLPDGQVFPSSNGAKR